MPEGIVDLTLLFPMWNEEAIAARTVGAAIEAGERLVAAGEVERFEVLIVDDGSTDATPTVLDGLADRDRRLRVVHHPRNRKLGAALRTGFEAAHGELVLYTGADLPFDLAEIEKALRLRRLHDADIVAAYRFDRIGEGPRRFVYSHAYNALVRAVFGLRVRDVNFSAKLLRRALLPDLDLRSEGSFIDVELLAKAERSGARIVQFGVDYFPRSVGTSTLSSPGVIVTMLREMVQLGPAVRRSGPRRR